MELVPSIPPRRRGRAARFWLPIALGLGILSIACGSMDTMTTPSPDPGTPTMTASIDGASWQAIGTASYSGGTLTVSGTGTSTPPQSIGFALVVGRPGTYAIGGGNTTGATAVLTIGSASWQSVPGSGSGTITIDTLTPAGVSGTFSFTATAVPGTTASGTKQVTTGAFNISY